MPSRKEQLPHAVPCPSVLSMDKPENFRRTLGVEDFILNYSNMYVFRLIHAFVCIHFFFFTVCLFLTLTSKLIWFFFLFSNQMTVSTNWTKTAQIYLFLFDDNRTVIPLSEGKPYSHYPERYEAWPQSRHRIGLTGGCYWEVEWERKVNIAVTYKDIEDYHSVLLELVLL